MIAVDTDRLLESFLSLVRIDSVTYEEAGVAERHVTKAFAALGLDVMNDGTGRNGAGNLSSGCRATATTSRPSC